MNAIKTKTAIVSFILLLVCLLATCEFTKQDENSGKPTPNDTLLLNQWRREKAEKTKLIVSYESRIEKLQNEKDSLTKVVETKKQSIASLRFKVSYFEDKLKQDLSRADTINKKVAGSILDSLVITQNKSDTTCDETIHTLEKIINNRDSLIAFHQGIEINLRDIQKSQELNTNLLTAQLETANKNLRKKSRQNRWLKGGLMILSGISTSLLITQKLK